MDTAPKFTASGADERRSEKRAALTMMRAAKLVCQSGEYVCLLRDLSTGGAKISLFHAVPSETHVFLELANGDVHAMIRMWERGTTAGFQFANPIDTGAFIAQIAHPKNLPISLRVRVPAMVMASGQAQPALVTSLAQGGARIELDGYLALGQSMVLSIDGIGECGAWVRARRGRVYDVEFEIVRRLDQFAALALALQPYGTPAPAAQPQRGVA